MYPRKQISSAFSRRGGDGAVVLISSGESPWLAKWLGCLVFQDYHFARESDLPKLARAISSNAYLPSF
jgi:hypothetical protein